MLEIQSSLDWQRVQNELQSATRKLTVHNKDLNILNKNIEKLVTELSKEEINCRRQTRQTIRHKELLDKCNKLIQNYEQMITFATLLN